MSYRIRKLRSRDRLDPDLVRCLIRRARSRYTVADYNDMSVVFAVTEAEGSLVALAGLACYHGSWCLRLALVDPAHRGHGLQRALIRARLRWLRRRGARRANMWVDPVNAYSLNNAVAEGFRFAREKPRTFHHRPHLKLRRDL